MRKPAPTTVDIHPVLKERWSPRSFDSNSVVKADDLDAIIEAARWAPSANNRQPWKFLIAHRGDERFAAISESLTGFNKEWAPKASAFILASAITADAEGKAIPTALFDLGLAVGFMSVEAHHRGYHIHQMAGFDRESLKATFGLAPELAPVVILAVGVATDASELSSDALKDREAAPRERKAVSEILL